MKRFLLSLGVLSLTSTRRFPGSLATCSTRWTFWMKRQAEGENGNELLNNEGKNMSASIRSIAGTFAFFFAIIIGLSGCSLMSCPPKLVKTRDDGYVMLINSSIGYAYTVRKLSSDNKQQWAISFEKTERDPGGAFSFTAEDQIRTLIETKDAGYIAAGSTAFKKIQLQSGTKYTTGWDVPLIIKLDSHGRTVWRSSLETSGGFRDVQEMSNGDLITCGLKMIDYHLLQSIGAAALFDGNGNRIWTLEFPGTDHLQEIEKTRDGYLLFGQFGGKRQQRQDPYVAKILPSGKVQWYRNYDISDGTHFISKAIVTSDGGAVFAGGISSGNHDGNMYIARIESNGSLRWKTFVEFEERGSFALCPTIYDLYPLPTGELLIIGTVEYGYPKGFLSKIDAAGKEVWTKPTTKDGKRYRFQQIQKNQNGAITLIGVLEEGRQRHQIHSITVSQNGDSKAANH